MDSVKPLLDSIGWKGAYQMEAIPRLGNNRVFKIVGDGRPLLLKVYFHDPEDNRDRLKKEYSFLQFLWKGRVRTVPEPLAQDPVNKMALYEFIEGAPLQEKNITKGEILEAANFFKAINNLKNSHAAKDLELATEATFSIQEQLQSVEDRLNKLKTINDKDSAYHKQAKTFVIDRLIPAWREVAAFVEREAKRYGLILGDKLEKSFWCLSPSDFGFHNSLRTRNGTLRFFDFEYAGWDNPAKMISDFYFQPRFRISSELMPIFLQSVLLDFPNSDQLKIKIALARPIFGMKWSCIMLNEFLPLGHRKRTFSIGETSWEERLAQRLENSIKQHKRVFPLNLDLTIWN